MKKKYFILASIFLFNPIVSIIDIFPDALGYLFLMLALKNASYIYDNAYDAYSSIKKLFIISTVKFACILLLPLTDATMALVFSFSFGIAEVIFAIYAFSGLFDAIDYISSRCGALHATRCDNMKKFTIAFTIVKLLMAFMPDLTALSIGENVGEIQISSFRSMFFVISSIITFVVGVVWLVKFIKFTNIVLNDDMVSEITKNFNEQISPRKTIFISRDAMSALIMIFVGSFFVFDFNFDGSNILPDCIFSVFVLISYLFMYKKGYIKYEKLHNFFFGAVGIHIIACALGIVFERAYLNKYDFVNALRVEDAKLKYIPIIIFAAIGSIAFVFILWMTLKIVKNYTIKTITENPQFYCESKIDDFMSEYLSELKKRNIISLSIGIILALIYILVTAFIPYNEALTVLNSVIEVIFIFAFSKSILYVYDTVYAKMLKYS